MESKMDRFREFANKHPLLRDEVRNGKRTWQNIYEEWVLYGEDDPQWQNYVASPNTTQQPIGNDNTVDSIRNIVGYIQKINPDTITKTLNTIQKVVQIIQTVGGNNRHMLPQNNMMPSIYNDWWD